MTSPGGDVAAGPPPDDPDIPAVSNDVGVRARVLLADDHAVVLQGLKGLVNAQRDMVVVAEAVDGEAVLRIAAVVVPDVIVMDLSMPIVGGADATARLSRELPSVRVVALTVHEDAPYLAQVLKAGAYGYVLKRSAPEHLLAAIRAASAGGRYIDPAVAGTLVQGYVATHRERTAPSNPRLSDRERVVLVGIARGYTNREIAGELAVSVKTIETYKARFVAKLGLRTRVDIARYAAENGLDAASREGGVQ